MAQVALGPVAQVVAAPLARLAGTGEEEKEEAPVGSGGVWLAGRLACRARIRGKARVSEGEEEEERCQWALARAACLTNQWACLLHSVVCVRLDGLGPPLSPGLDLSRAESALMSACGTARPG